MADCELMTTCVFFNDRMANMPATAELMKKRYCRGDRDECARYVVYQALGRDNVPGDLPPNQLDRARRLVAHHRH